MNSTSIGKCPRCHQLELHISHLTTRIAEQRDFINQLFPDVKPTIQVSSNQANAGDEIPAGQRAISVIRAAQAERNSRLVQSKAKDVSNPS